MKIRTQKTVKVLKHLLLFGGVYLLVILFYIGVFIYMPYTNGGIHSVLGIHVLVGLVIWAAIGMVCLKR